MKSIKWFFAVTFSVLSINASATEVPSTTIMDNYIGAGYDRDVKGYKSKYDVDKMIVSRDGTTLNVDVFTSFYNDIGTSGIKLGDLFMAADDNLNGVASPWAPNGALPNTGDRYSSSNSNTGTDWNYVYDLSGARNSTSGMGQLKSGIITNNLVVSSNLHDGARYNQAVMNGDYTNQKTHNADSSWSVASNSSYSKQFTYWSRTDNRYKSYNVGYGKVSFSFDVTNTALATANQIAFRWAMTCANDIIEGVASFASTPDGSTSVPEPQSIMLMLLAMAGLTYRRKVKQA